MQRSFKNASYRDLRGLVLHVLPSGTATWYFHYDLRLGRSRKRRRLKIGRLDDVSLADAADRAEELRPIVRKGGDPVAGKAVEKTLPTLPNLPPCASRRGGGSRKERYRISASL